MIAETLVFNSYGEVLMARQTVQRGAIVWNFPDGKAEADETPEAAY